MPKEIKYSKKFKLDALNLLHERKSFNSISKGLFTRFKDLFAEGAKEAHKDMNRVEFLMSRTVLKSTLENVLEL